MSAISRLFGKNLLKGLDEIQASLQAVVEKQE